MTLAYDDKKYEDALERLEKVISSEPVKGTLASISKRGREASVVCPYGNRCVGNSRLGFET